MPRKQVQKASKQIQKVEVEHFQPEEASDKDEDLTASSSSLQATTTDGTEAPTSAPYAHTLSWKEAIETSNIHAIRFHLEALKEQTAKEIIDLDLQNTKTGANALMLSCLAAQKDLVEHILDLTSFTLQSHFMVKTSSTHHSDVVDNLGNTALHLACRGGDLYVVILLITSLKTKAGYSQQPQSLPEVKYVNQKNHRGSTPLMYAAHKGHLEIVKYLVEEYRANLKAKNKDELTAQDLCKPKYVEEAYVDNRHALVHDYLTTRQTSSTRQEMFKVIFVTLIIPMTIVCLYLFVGEPYLKRQGIDPMALLQAYVRSLLLPK